MSQYQREELSIVLQLLLSIFLMAIVSYYIALVTSTFPWYALLGFGIGLSIILVCWIGKSSTLFVSFLMLYSIVYSVAYNFAAIFPSH